CAYQWTTQRLRPAASGRRRRRDLVDAVKLMISERLHASPSLTELSDVFGCSPYHLSRTFHHTAGESLRRYVRRLKARIAADRLTGGEANLTALALDLGYADHSHFTNSFRQEWGVTPSSFRAKHRVLHAPARARHGGPQR